MCKKVNSYIKDIICLYLIYFNDSYARYSRLNAQ